MRRILVGIAGHYKNLQRIILKLRGMTPATRSNRRVTTGEVWDDFCDTLKGAGANILKHKDLDHRTKAEGYRYLSRLIRAGLEAFVEYADPAAPVLRRMVHETVKMGADNPDNYYENAIISGKYEYRITGNRGTVHFLTFSTHEGGYGQSGGLPPSGLLDSRELIVQEDGSLEITLSTKPQQGNWLPMEHGTGMVMVRQTFLDKEKENPANLKIKQINSVFNEGAVSPGFCDDEKSKNPPSTVLSRNPLCPEPLSPEPLCPEPLSPQRIDEGLMKAADLVAGATFLFSRWTQKFQAHANKLPRFDPEVSTAAGGDPEIAYYHSFWRLKQDEALVIEATPPPCEHWNFQLNNFWMESLDYRYFRIHLNKETAVYREDGSVVVVVAHKDPGVPNWLTTTGLPMGTMCWRWIRAIEHPVPQTRVVRLSAFKQQQM